MSKINVWTKENRGFVMFLIGMAIVCLAIYASFQASSRAAETKANNDLTGCRSNFNAVIVTPANNDVSSAIGEVSSVSLRQQAIITQALADLLPNGNQAEIPVLLASQQQLEAETTTALATLRATETARDAAQTRYNSLVVLSLTKPHEFLDQCHALHKA